MKACIRCGVTKPAGSFHKRGGRTDRMGKCAACRAVTRTDRVGCAPSRSHNRALPAVESPTTADLHWAAGLLEGDGWFMRGPTVGATQVEWFPVVKLIRMFGGLARPVKPRKPTQNWQVEWEVNGARARGVMYTLYPLLSPKRKAQIEKALKASTPAG